MDKNAIKKYAVWARRELIARVSQKAEQYGIAEKEIVDERAENIHGAVLTPAQQRQRQALISLIRRDGYQQAMEEVAYTWFNRFIALRFMEVNDYLPGHTRAFTDEQNAFKPKILSDALNLELTGLNLDKVIELKETNKTEELYQYLLITLCNHLSAILPGMFQRIDDYTELLFPEHLLREGSVLEQLVSIIPQEDWLDAVQIIGWLYQYYNAEPKDQVFANLKKNIKISKENIPAATQLFTPDWIVRYMVENSLGRLWVEGHPSEALKAGWKYYLEEAEQEPEVQTQLQVIHSEYAQMKPEDILCIDPCSGSGHILVYLFDVLVQIYEAYGYPTRDAVASIVQNNLWGLDIDDRAAQLAYFAIMMKARQYDKGWFRRGIEPHVFALQDSPNVDDAFYAFFEEEASTTRKVIQAFKDAKEYGSIIQPDLTIDELNRLDAKMNELLRKIEQEDLAYMAQAMVIYQAMTVQLRQARALTQKYHVVVTNPPYMGSSGMGDNLFAFIRSKYSDSKSDLFAVFIERCGVMLHPTGYQAMITQHAWMFLSSFDKLRRSIEKTDIINMAHLGSRAFEEIGGEVVQTTAFVLRGNHTKKYKGTYCRLIEPTSQHGKEEMFLSKKNRFIAQQENYTKLPGAPIAYWASSQLIHAYDNRILNEIGQSRQGLATTDNNTFLRLWYEVDFRLVSFHCENRQEALASKGKWFPFNKGGEYRKWFGNNYYVINWENDGYDLKQLITKRYGNASKRIANEELYFIECITWSAVAASKPSFRYSPTGSLFDIGANGAFFKEHKQVYYIAGFLNSIVVEKLIQIINPTINTGNGVIGKLPVCIDDGRKEQIVDLVKKCIVISETEWDSFEISWNFQYHPLMPLYSNYPGEDGYLLADFYASWEKRCDERFQQLKDLEEKLNCIFIDIYDLRNELSPTVANKDVTVRKADLKRDIKSLISFAVGCMTGRYQYGSPGLKFAGGDWKAYSDEHFPNVDQMLFEPDNDGILPITDDEYFDDDIVSLFVRFISVVYGSQTLEDNLKFIADALGGTGTARQIIREYFINEFYKDHCNTYSVPGSGKRPIYWLFDAGKENSFKCLIYLHRYQPDTIARVRTDYVHEMQARYRTAMEELARRVETAGGSERVRLQKQLAKIQGQEEELRKYEEKIHHYADMMLPLDLDDGVKVNYAKLQDVLAPIK